VFASNVSEKEDQKEGKVKEEMAEE